MKLIILIFLSFLLTGCYNYRELNNINIASSIIFDYENDEYKVTVQINGEKENETIEGSGKNVSEALNQANLTSKKSLSFYHLKSVFITPNVEIDKVLLYLIRNPRINNSFYILYTEEKKLIEENKDKDVGNEVYDMLKKELNYTFFDLSSSIYNDNIDFYLPIINKELIIDGIMPYSKFQKTEPLDLDKINTFKILNNKIDSYISAKCGDGMIEVNVNSIDTKFKVEDKVQINIDMKVSIVEYDSNIKNYDVDGITKLEGIINSETKQLVDDLIKKLQENNADILGISRFIYNKDHNLDKDWKTYDYDINVNSKINKKGLILE